VVLISGTALLVPGCDAPPEVAVGVAAEVVVAMEFGPVSPPNFPKKPKLATHPPSSALSLMQPPLTQLLLSSAEMSSLIAPSFPNFLHITHIRG